MTEVLTRLEDKVDPAHTALVVIDMQNDFCADGGFIHKKFGKDMSGNLIIARRIADLIEAARKTETTVVWVQANYEPRFLSGAALAKLQEQGTESICCEGGTWGWDFYELAPEDGDIRIEKHTFSAFAGTELDRLLRFRGVKTLVMTGVATNVCVESTLRDGYFNGFYIVVAEDCVGAPVQALHDATLANVRGFFGDVVQAQEIMDAWDFNAARQAAE